MIISRNKILTAMKNALPGIDSNSSIVEGADTFIFKDGFIYSYNDTISVTTPFQFDEPIFFVVKAKEFFALINKFKDDEINFIVDDKSVSMKCGKAKASFAILTDSIAESVNKILQKDTEWEKVPDNFNKCLNKSIIKGNKYYMSGIFVNNTNMISTDGMRINFFNLSSPMKKFWITDQAANSILKVSNFTEFCYSKSWVHFKDSNGTVLSCKKQPDEGYPENTFEIILLSHKMAEGDLSNDLPDGLTEAINRAVTLSMDVEDRDAVQLTFSKDKLSIFSERTSGTYSENIPWEKPFDNEFEPVVIYIDGPMIENGIAYSRKFYLKTLKVKTGLKTRIVFLAEDGLHLVGTLAKEEKN